MAHDYPTMAMFLTKIPWGLTPEPRPGFVCLYPPSEPYQRVRACLVIFAAYLSSNAIKISETAFRAAGIGEPSALHHPTNRRVKHDFASIFDV